MRFVKTLSSRPWMIAVGLTAIVLVWLASGALRPRPGTTADVAAPATETAARVQIRAREAEPVTRTIRIYGRTAPARKVEMKAETSGRVTMLGVERGKRAKAGQVLLKLDLRDRQARLEQARAGVSEHQAAWEAQQELKPQGYVSDTQLAETRAKLDAARAELVRAELDLDYMQIRAPFDGTVQERAVEVGDYVRPGDPVVTFVDNTHLVVTGSVAEHDAGFVRVGELATAALVTGQEVKGRVRYLAPVADEATRTFTVEMEIPNPTGDLPAGVTAEMRITGGDVLAYRVAPSLLTLDANGTLGIKTVSAQNRVEFHKIDIAHSDANGVWVTGLPDSADIIVIGQGYVSAGQTVQAVEARPEETALAAGKPIAKEASGAGQ
ncbi:MAG: efflux RND transporter periplasmic adaptor subunit [Gammaproteobacteria bacterium]|nr:efflux RND transporter periplasmic adaptor subunit [Gammaproteobacteria bacterium]MDH5276956.1 efflux RND transporter periplasmic adaptor subunit [Gammaproteobacteria bacterium]